IRHTLSDLEWKVFCMYIRGDGYKEIAVKLNRSEKSIDNALNRIKKKAGTLLEEESN
ncbi:MAG: RNA polymerase sporulation sigma factor SigH, partial [Lachnospiraceae bacterium]|nr:RNA polymerase sporulation sigma factor SigH [Lachnospiraceae bacterium]